MTTVLVIEDDSFLVDAYSTKLRKAGFKTILATNGEEGLKQAKTNKPDVVLLDLLIPKRNGFDVLADLKADKHLRHVPVIVLSNLGQERDVEQVRQLGAEDYLIKANVTMKEIIAKIKQVTSGHHHKVKKNHQVKTHQAPMNIVKHVKHVGHVKSIKHLPNKQLKSVEAKSEFKERTTDKVAKKVKLLKPVKMVKLLKVKSKAIGLIKKKKLIVQPKMKAIKSKVIKKHKVSKKIKK